MKTANWKLIRAIAAETRHDLEAYGDFIYKELQMDFEDDLCGLCVFASKLLHRRLKSKGIVSRIIQGSNEPNDIFASHVWVEVDGKVVDLTASQFNKNHPRVYIRKHPPRDGDGRRLYPTKRKSFSDWSHAEKPTPERIRKFEAFCKKQRDNS